MAIPSQKKKPAQGAGSEPTDGEEGTPPAWGKPGTEITLAPTSWPKTQVSGKPLSTPHPLHEQPQLPGVALCLVAVAVVEQDVDPLGLPGKLLDRTNEVRQLVFRVQVVEPLGGGKALLVPVRAVAVGDDAL
jgi:hypothetical protein